MNGPRATAIVALAASFAVSGCSKQVVVETTFPEPVIPSLELNAGVYYTETLKNYAYTEDLPNDIEWSFTLGKANIQMFDRALGALFETMVPVDQPGGTDARFEGLDVVIEPQIEAFEFSLPRQSRSDQYAVWIRYNLAVYEPGGTLITNWRVSAYGQADSRMFGSGDAMEMAVVRAMRDAIANIVIGFPNEPVIKTALLPEEAMPAATPTEELAAEPVPTDDTEPKALPSQETPAEENAIKPTPGDEIQS